MRWCRAYLGLLLLALVTLGASAASPKRVLILDPFGRDVAPFSAAVSSFRATLAREIGERVDIYELPLELARLAEAEGEGPLVAFLEGQVKAHPVDLVVPIGAPGVQFAVRHRQRLFPDTPVLAVAVASQLVPPGFLQTNTTLLTQQADLPGIVEDILRLQPQTTNIVVVLGTSALEKFWMEECRREFQPFTNRVNFTWLNDLSSDQILNRCATLPPRSFIFHAFFIVDAAGIHYEHNEVLRRLHEVANAPVFGYFASDLGLGAIGGRLFQDSELGAQGARTAIRILRGEQAGRIPVQTMEAPRPTYDWRELRRWGISKARLPAGSVVRFHQPGMWERYWWLVCGGILFCAVEAALIVGLLVNRAKRHHGERMATLIADLSSRFINLHTEKVDTEIEAAQRRVCEGIGLDLSALWQWTDGSPQYFKMTHLYRPLGGPPTPERFDAQEAFPWCLKELLAGRVIPVSSMDALPPEAGRDRESWLHFGIKSNLTVPLLIEGGQLIGGLSFNTVRKARSWPKEVVERLEVVAQIFANALARKRADQELRDSEARLSLAADAAAAGLWRLDLATRWFWVTQKTRELFAFGADEVVTFDRFLNLVHPEDRESVRQKVQQVLESKGEVHVEYRILQPDGRVQWMYSRGRVNCDGSGQPHFLMGVTVDISEAKRAATEMQGLRLQLWHADRVAQTGAITASLAHELNQPLTGILSTAQAGLRFSASGNADGALIREMLSNIVHDTKRAAGVINGLRAMLGRKETRRETIDLAATTQEVMDLVHSELIGRQVQASQKLEPDFTVVADRGQIQQVLLNLVMNALEAMQNQPAEQRHLNLALARTETGEALVSLRDSGPGVPEGGRDKLFEAFWTTKKEGMGIGLAISRSIIESHGGRLWFANNPDRGATFYFSLPVANPSASKAFGKEATTDGE